MTSEQLTGMYEQASALAEAGQHAAALEQFLEYLRYRPQDGQALNDAATLLYCLGRSQEAIGLYEKACQFCQGDALTQVYWNLSEVYLQEGRVGNAAALFDAMQAQDILNADMLNRAANAFLEQDALGPAVELLLRSLRINPDQEILQPMLEVIRSKRMRVSLVAERCGLLSRSLAESLSQRLPLTQVEPSAAAIADAPAELVIFVGVGAAMSQLSHRAAGRTIIAVLTAQDVYGDHLNAVNWAAVSTVLLCGGRTLRQQLTERLGAAAQRLRIVEVEPIVNPDTVAFSPRKKGKKIAAVGPWDARRNPMFALMCFQKLHYMDADMRLYLAGAFEDAATEQYVLSMIETLGLENAVFWDGAVRDTHKWLKDKQYILSTAIDGAGLEEVWLAAAAGLRPLVHTFSGSAEMMDSGYLFTLAEDFCRQVIESPFDSMQYRAMAQRRYTERGLEKRLLEQIDRIEKEHRSRRPQAKEAPVLPTFSAAQASPSPAAAAPAIPTAMPSPSQANRPIQQAASEALTASQRLRQLAEQMRRQGAFTVSEPNADSQSESQDDSFKYNTAESLPVVDILQEGIDSVPFAGQRRGGAS